MRIDFHKPIVVGNVNPDTNQPYEHGEAVFSTPYQAAEWCEAQNTPWREWLPNPANPAVVEVNGRLIRASQCFSRQMLAIAIRAARDGICVGEPAIAEAVDA